MNAQGEALLALARKRGLLDESGRRGSRKAEQALEALEQSTREKLLKTLARLRFRCKECKAERSWDDLADLPSLACPRCEAPLSASEGRASKREASKHEAAKLTTSRTRLSQAKEIGPYKLLKVLGKGASGVVLLARKPGLDRDFALKILTANSFDDALAVERFRRESQVASRLQHPGIVSVVDVGEAQGDHYYVMEYVKGPTLQAYLKERAPLPPQDAALLVAELARAIAFAHENEIVHRDMKPANVILDETTGKPRITDFGLARDARDHRVTRTGDMLGTPYYMSPEQFHGDKTIDGRTDIWALGVILYEALTAARPFDAKTAAMLASEVLNAELRPPSEHRRDLPAALDAICLKALARERDERYARASDLADDLDRFRKGKRTEAKAETTIERTVRKTKRHVTARMLVLPALLAGAVGGAVILSLTRRADAPAAPVADAAPDPDAELIRLLASDASLAKARASVEARGSLRPGLAVAWARRLLRSGCYAEAIRVATPLERDPACATSASLAVAEACAKTGDLALAVSTLTELAGRDPVARARRLSFERRWNEAAEAALAAIRERPLDGLALRTAAVALLERDGPAPAEAMKYAQEALDLDPEDPDASVVWAYAACAAGRPLEEVDRALDRAKERTAPEPPDPLALVTRGWAALLRRDPVGAREPLEAALRALKEDPEALTLLFWAKFLAEEKDAPLARQRARAASPSRHEATLDELARRVRGDARSPLSPAGRQRMERLVAAGDPEARSALRRALEAASSGASASATEDWWRLALLLAPGDAPCALLHARYLVGHDRYQTAREAIDAARKLPSADATELDRLEADRLWRQSDVPGAAELWVKLAGGKGATAAYARAAHLIQTGKVNEAQKTLRTALEADPEVPELHRLLAFTTLIAYPFSTDEARAAATFEARRALEIEGSLDLENAFLADFGAWTPILNQTDNEVWRARYAALEARYGAVNPETGRYSYYLARLALKFEHAKDVALGRLKATSERTGQPWLDLGTAFLHVRYNVESKRPEEIKLAEESLRAVRAADRGFWIPWDLLNRIKEVDKSALSELKNAELPALPRP